MVAHLTMILLIYFLAAMAVHLMHQRHTSRPESGGFEQILLIPSNQAGRIEGVIRSLCLDLLYRGKSFSLTVVAEHQEDETLTIIEKMMQRQGMELSYLPAVPAEWEHAAQKKDSYRLIDLRKSSDEAGYR